MGNLVPTVEILHDEELEAADIWPVCLSYIPGETWAASRKQKDPKFNIAVMGSLAKALTRCFVDNPSAAVVQHQVISKLERLLASSREEIIHFGALLANFWPMRMGWKSCLCSSPIWT